MAPLAATIRALSVYLDIEAWTVASVKLRECAGQLHLRWHF
jgi:hypothetical protein